MQIGRGKRYDCQKVMSFAEHITYFKGVTGTNDNESGSDISTNDLTNWGLINNETSNYKI